MPAGLAGRQTRPECFDVASDRRDEPEPYVAFRRDGVHIGALRDPVRCITPIAAHRWGSRLSSKLTTSTTNWSGSVPLAGRSPKGSAKPLGPAGLRFPRPQCGRRAWGRSRADVYRVP